MINLFCYFWFRIFNNVKIYIFSRLFYEFKAVSMKILGERERVRERETLCACMNWQADSFIWILSCFWRKIFENTLLDYKTYYKSTRIKTVWNWLKKRQRSNSVYDLGALKDFLKRQVRWSGIPISFRIFHSLLWSTESKALA